MKPKVIVMFQMCEDVFRTLSDIAEVRFGPFPDKEKLLEELKDAKAVIAGVEPIGEEFLKNAPELRIVARYGVGYDNVDVEACTRRGIYVTHTPGILSNAVGELTMGLMLCLSRRLLDADRYTRTEWAKPKSAKLPFGIDLEGKTLGIVGLGRIGYAVACKAKAFGMELVYYDVIRNEIAERNLGARFLSLDKLLILSDFVTVHVPLTNLTRGLIGERELRLMKKTAFLINTSRGPVIDEEALCKALEEGWIAGAALDVFVKEPLPFESPLIKMKNVVLTPHIGTATIETRRKMAQMDVENVRKALKGEVPPNLVPEQKGKTFKK